MLQEKLNFTLEQVKGEEMGPTVQSYKRCICGNGTRTDFEKGCPTHDPSVGMSFHSCNKPDYHRVKELESQLAEASKREGLLIAALDRLMAYFDAAIQGVVTDNSDDVLKQATDAIAATKIKINKGNLK